MWGGKEWAQFGASFTGSTVMGIGSRVRRLLPRG